MRNKCGIDSEGKEMLDKDESENIFQRGIDSTDVKQH